LQALVDCIGHNDYPHDFHHTSSMAVTKFILLIWEHLSDHVVSDVKQSPCWAYSMVDETTNMAALSIPLATAWPE